MFLTCVSTRTVKLRYACTCISLPSCQSNFKAKQYMTTSSNGNISRVTGPLWETSPVTGEFPAQRPVTHSIDVFFYLHLNKWLSKHSWGWWFETPSHSLGRHCNEMKLSIYWFQDFLMTLNGRHVAFLCRCDIRSAFIYTVSIDTSLVLAASYSIKGLLHRLCVDSYWIMKHISWHFFRMAAHRLTSLLLLLVVEYHNSLNI